MPTPIFEEGFESPGSSGLPEGWAGSGRVVPEAYEGQGALLVVDDKPNLYGLVTSSRFDIGPGVVCELSVQVRTDVVDAGGAQIRVRVEEYDGPISETGTTLIVARWITPPRTTEWQQTRFGFTTTSATGSMRFVFYSAYGAGVDKIANAWFDAFRLDQLPEPAPVVVDGWGNAIPVTSVEDVTVQMTPAEFWAKPAAAPTDTAVRSRSLWSYPIFRRHFFGLDLGLPKRISDYHNNLPHFEKTLGVPVDIANPAVQNVIADDIVFNPIVHAHPATTGSYSKLYYPRRMNDWLVTDFVPAYAMTEDSAIGARMTELLDFLQYSQYDEEGHNPFTARYFPEDHAKSVARGWVKEWIGSWDYVYDWEWLDGYGYFWRLHSGDHHVCAGTAADIIDAYELTGRRSDLDSAKLFVKHMIGLYGWHTGIWENRRYYWTEYNPTGPTNPKRDATDNVQALIARSVAAVGYYENDRRKLEYARGLLWYLVREWRRDGRWYYDGAENPINQRRFISHDMACLQQFLAAAAYLLAAGVRIDPELECLTDAYDFYLDNYQFKPMIWVKYGQVTKLAPRRVDERWQFTSLFTANRPSNRVVVRDVVPSAMASGTRIVVRVSRLLPPTYQDDDWRIDRRYDRQVLVTAAELAAGIATGWNLVAGDVIRFNYSLATSADPWVDLASSSVTYTMTDGTAPVVNSWLPDKEFPGVATDANFPSVASRLIFPRCASRSAVFTPPS